MWPDSYSQSVLYILLGVTCLWLLRKIVRILLYYDSNSGQRPSVPLPSKPDDAGHHWRPGGLLLPLHCCMCHGLLLATSDSTDAKREKSFHCSDCGLASCSKQICLKKAQKEFKCKEIARFRPDKDNEGSRSGHFHHWVSGNLPLLSECDVCDQSCSDAPESGLEDLKCCWCHRTVHKACLQKISRMCDFGRYAEFIVAPERITAKPARTVRYPRRWIISKVDGGIQLPKRQRPLIVVGNSKAGNNDGSQFLNALRGELNPAQVIDLDSSKMEDGLRWCQLIEEETCVLLIAGGDGTIGWALNTLDAMNVADKHPKLALLPLGTGNDLARTLGYGPGGEVDNVR